MLILFLLVYHEHLHDLLDVFYNHRYDNNAIMDNLHLIHCCHYIYPINIDYCTFRHQRVLALSTLLVILALLIFPLVYAHTCCPDRIYHHLVVVLVLLCVRLFELLFLLF